ncbi:MAG TPA: hypothetical protein VFS34_17530 [Thermoanaerobaculia bacterium]|nr:hypothetical protein [Thermoanaerobaculia bacterium]
MSGSSKWAGLFAGVLFAAAASGAESRVQGQLVVDGKPVRITHVYAFAQKGFFDEKKLDVVLLFCDAAVPPAAVRDPFARTDLVKAGKLHCVEQTIDEGGQVINYKVQHERFGVPEGGGSTEHVFEAKTFDGKTAAGRSRTTAPQKSYDDVPYEYDITFSTPIEPKK